ncbi:MAG: PH domain-containing protein [Prevotella sp.]|nr:PH domain-containing protein [Prevotella sp.]
MGYIEDSLMEGEKIMYEAKLHYFMYWFPALLVILGIALPFIPLGEIGLRLIFAGVLLLLALIWAFVINNGKRFIVTNRRVIEKRGIIKRESIELMLRKCEGVKVEQSILGRIFGYGKVVVSTGEVTNIYDFIWHPVKFSTQINQQIDQIHGHLDD